eukprot:COSAG04_NODE_4088_length_2315_cov_1.082581_3_plen_195_part_00
MSSAIESVRLRTRLFKAKMEYFGTSFCKCTEKNKANKIKVLLQGLTSLVRPKVPPKQAKASGAAATPSDASASTASQGATASAAASEPQWGQTAKVFIDSADKRAHVKACLELEGKGEVPNPGTWGHNKHKLLYNKYFHFFFNEAGLLQGGERVSHAAQMAEEFLNTSLIHTEHTNAHRIPSSCGGVCLMGRAR